VSSFSDSIVEAVEEETGKKVLVITMDLIFDQFNLLVLLDVVKCKVIPAPILK
jgi:hypothetical protein